MSLSVVTAMAPCAVVPFAVSSSLERAVVMEGPDGEFDTDSGLGPELEARFDSYWGSIGFLAEEISILKAAYTPAYFDNTAKAIDHIIYYVLRQLDYCKSYDETRGNLFSDAGLDYKSIYNEIISVQLLSTFSGLVESATAAESAEIVRLLGLESPLGLEAVIAENNEGLAHSYKRRLVALQNLSIDQPDSKKYNALKGYRRRGKPVPDSFIEYENALQSLKKIYECLGLITKASLLKNAKLLIKSQKIVLVNPVKYVKRPLEEKLTAARRSLEIDLDSLTLNHATPTFPNPIIWGGICVMLASNEGSKGQIKKALEALSGACGADKKEALEDFISRECFQLTYSSGERESVSIGFDRIAASLISEGEELDSGLCFFPLKLLNAPKVKDSFDRLQQTFIRVLPSIAHVDCAEKWLTEVYEISQMIIRIISEADDRELNEFVYNIANGVSGRPEMFLNRFMQVIVLHRSRRVRENILKSLEGLKELHRLSEIRSEIHATVRVAEEQSALYQALSDLSETALECFCELHIGPISICSFLREIGRIQSSSEVVSDEKMDLRSIANSLLDQMLPSLCPEILINLFTQEWEVSPGLMAVAVETPASLDEASLSSMLVMPEPVKGALLFEDQSKVELQEVFLPVTSGACFEEKGDDTETGSGRLVALEDLKRFHKPLSGLGRSKKEKSRKKVPSGASMLPRAGSGRSECHRTLKEMEALVGFSRRNTSYRGVHQAITKRGFIEDHTTGDHVIYVRGRSSISVPKHPVLKLGLLHSLIKKIQNILHNDGV